MVKKDRNYIKDKIDQFVGKKQYSYAFDLANCYSYYSEIAGRLGKLYYYGHGTDKSIEKAKKWLTYSSKNGIIWATELLNKINESKN